VSKQQFARIDRRKLQATSLSDMLPHDKSGLHAFAGQLACLFDASPVNPRLSLSYPFFLGLPIWASVALVARAGAEAFVATLTAFGFFVSRLVRFWLLAIVASSVPVGSGCRKISDLLRS
jgi:hypothetical protein